MKRLYDWFTGPWPWWLRLWCFVSCTAVAIPNLWHHHWAAAGFWVMTALSAVTDHQGDEA